MQTCFHTAATRKEPFSNITKLNTVTSVSAKIFVSFTMDWNDSKVIDWTNVDDIKEAFDSMRTEMQRLARQNNELIDEQAKSLVEIARLNDEIRRPRNGNSLEKRKNGDTAIDSLANASKRSISFGNYFRSTNSVNRNSASGSVLHALTPTPNGKDNNSIATNENENGLPMISDDNAWRVVTSKNMRKVKENAVQKTTPIQLQQMKPTELVNLGVELAKKVPKNEMFFHQMSENKMPRITCENEVAKEVVITHLKENGIEFNSFNNSASRKKSFIIRGLIVNDTDEAIDLIRDAVTEMGLTGNYEIGRFETSYQRFHPSNDRLSLYRVTVGASTDDSLLLNMRTIGYSRVRVERMKKSTVVQCHRCQRLHHTTGQCNFTYRCVQCIVPHQYGDCPRVTNKNLPIGCINCADAKLNHADHTANDLRNCSYFKAKADNLLAQQQQKQQKQQKQQNTRAPVTINHQTQQRNSRSNSAGYANALKGDGNNIGGFTTAQLAELISMTVKSVISSINNGI